jgi:NAD(P)-dependent dehydrogenase (short-subunit alcohol dehydrogenase family)
MGTNGLFSLKGRTAVVTGASRGLGEAIAVSLADAGADLVLASRDEACLEKVAADVKSRGVQCVTVRADMLNAKDVQAMTDKAIAEFGKIDVLVNNAGINVVKPFIDLTEQDWDSVLDTNLKGYFFCSQAVGREMLKRKSGCVINNASVFGRTGFMNLAPYIASKGAIVQLTKALAVEWARFNVRVNCIAPSYIVTEMAKKDIESNPKILEQNIKKIPMRRGGEPREVGSVVTFLASDAASFMTGETVAIDGGWLAW